MKLPPLEYSYDRETWHLAPAENCEAGLARYLTPGTFDAYATNLRRLFDGHELVSNATGEYWRIAR